MAKDRSERSSLLAETSNGRGDQTKKSNGTFSEPAVSYNRSHHNNNGNDNEDGADLERQTSIDEARERQFEGNPEIKARLKYILPAVGVGTWLAAADTTMVVACYANIGSDLRELNKTSWIALAYFLSLTSFQPLYGKLSDIFGRKPMLLLAYIIFATGCVWCGLARDMDSLIIARAFAGIGGGGMTTVVSILLSDIVPLKERDLWQGIINLIFAAGAASGAPLGGLLADSVGWRVAFWAQGPICLIALVTVYFVLNEPLREQEPLPEAAATTTSSTTTTNLSSGSAVADSTATESNDNGNGVVHLSPNWKRKLYRVDWFGAVTLIAAVSLLLIGLDRGSNGAWQDRVTVATLASSIPAIALWIYIEGWQAAEPFAPGRVVFGRQLSGAFLCNFFTMSAFYPLIFYVPLYLQVVARLSASQAGVQLIPYSIVAVIGSLGSGILIRRSGRYWALNTGGFAVLSVGAVILTLVASVGGTGTTSDISTTPLIVALCICAFGNGTGITTSLIALISNAAAADQAIVTACSYLFRSLGSVLGLAGVSAVLQQQLRSRLAARLVDGGDNGKDHFALDPEQVDAIVASVRESLDSITALPPPLAAIVRQTYAQTLHTCFAVIAALAACAFISALFVREKRLSK